MIPEFLYFLVAVLVMFGLIPITLSIGMAFSSLTERTFEWLMEAMGR